MKRTRRSGKQFKISGDKTQFDKVFAEFDSLNTQLYNEFVANMSTSLKSNPSSFWQFVNSKKEHRDHSKATPPW